MSFESPQSRETRETRERNRQRLSQWMQETEAKRIQKQEERTRRAETREVGRSSSRLPSWRNVEIEEPKQIIRTSSRRRSSSNVKEEEESEVPKFLLETVSQTPKRRNKSRDDLRLPKISDEMENVITEALNEYLDDNEILCNAFNISITRRDVKTLAYRNWLNDQVI
jgi:Ulp1 family protease